MLIRTTNTIFSKVDAIIFLALTLMKHCKFNYGWKEKPMPEQYPEWLAATLAADATEGRQVLPPGWLNPIKPGSKVLGPAFTVEASQDDNQALVNALASQPPEGSVLVVSGMNTSRTATIGGLMALEILNLGLAGLVTDGLVRDVEEIRQLGLPVWCRGTTPVASFKRNPGRTGGSVVIGGIVVNTGDLVIADDDGVVIWPQAEISELLNRARAKLDKDNVRLARLQEIARQRQSGSSDQ